MYQIYIGNNIILPIAPQFIILELPDRNEIVDLVSGYEYNRINYPGLQSVSFSFILPADFSEIPFTISNGRFVYGWDMYTALQEMKQERNIFQFTIVRYINNQISTYFDTLIKFATIGELKLREDVVEAGKNLIVDITIKEYNFIGPQEVNFNINNRAEIQGSERPVEVATGNQTYIVKRGDTLQSIARSLYGDSNAWQLIYSANKKQIDDTAAKAGWPKYSLNIGQVLTIPPYARPVKTSSSSRTPTTSNANTSNANTSKANTSNASTNTVQTNTTQPSHKTTYVQPNVNIRTIMGKYSPFSNHGASR